MGPTPYAGGHAACPTEWILDSVIGFLDIQKAGRQRALENAIYIDEVVQGKVGDGLATVEAWSLPAPGCAADALQATPPAFF